MIPMNLSGSMKEILNLVPNPSANPFESVLRLKSIVHGIYLVTEFNLLIHIIVVS